MITIVALSACASQGSIPGAQTNAPQAFQAQPNAAAGACAKSLGWTFGGPCKVAVLSDIGRTVKFTAYQGYTATIDFGPGSYNTGRVLAVHVATGKGDITGGTRAFKPYRGIGKTFFYIGMYNGGKAFTFDYAPAVRIAGPIPGTTPICDYAFLWDGTDWITAVAGKSTGKVASFPVESVPPSIDVPNGPFFLAFSCE